MKTYRELLLPVAILAACLAATLFAINDKYQSTPHSIATTSWMYNDLSAAKAAGLIKTQAPMSGPMSDDGQVHKPNFQSQLNGLIMQKLAAPDTQTLDGGEKGGSWRITAHGAVPIDTPPAGAVTLPHLFLPAVAVYKDKRFLGLVVGKTIHLSCRDALDATQSAIAKHFEAVDGSTAIGLCIPVQAFSVADLVPPELATPKFPPHTAPAKPEDDNQV